MTFTTYSFSSHRQAALHGICQGLGMGAVFSGVFVFLYLLGWIRP